MAKLFTNISFTNSQEEAIKVIRDWYVNDKSLTFTLTGKAGTGKSFIAKYLAKNVFKSKRIAVTAPTHKAVGVISKFTGLTGFTLQSMHGLRPNYSLEDFNVNSLRFEPLGSNKFMNYDILICDESSMISQGIEQLNKIRAKQYNVKILYLGDKLQLPPVKEHKISKIFDNEYTYNLTDIVRQKEESPLIKLLDVLREDVINTSSNFIKTLKTNRVSLDSDNHGYIVTNRKDFQQIVVKYFNSERFRNDSSLFRVGTYTKDRVNMWNTYIRSKIFGDTDILVKGDILMGYKTIVDEYLAPVVINSTDYLVVDVAKHTSDFGFEMFVTTILDIQYQTTKEVFIVDHKSKSFGKYKGIVKTLHHNALYCEDVLKKRERWEAFYNFKDSFICMVDIPIAYGYENSTIDKEIDYGYGSTIHKLQGSTINTVLLDLLNIVYYSDNNGKSVVGNYRNNTKKNPYALDTRNRLIYTGVSRASELAINLFY